jgi:putative (di)nucleoside polyphosphate hydrolase
MTTVDEPVGAYRLNVGIALFGPDGRVLIARRLADDGPEIILPGFEWQMPQGGIDPGEDPEAAARRELWEETGVTSAHVIATYPGSLTYDFPLYDGQAAPARPLPRPAADLVRDEV